MGLGHLGQGVETETPVYIKPLQKIPENSTQQFRRQERKIVSSLVEGNKNLPQTVHSNPYFKWLWSPDLS